MKKWGEVNKRCKKGGLEISPMEKNFQGGGDRSGQKEKKGNVKPEE